MTAIAYLFASIAIALGMTLGYFLKTNALIAVSTISLFILIYYFWKRDLTHDQPVNKLAATYLAGYPFL